MWMCECRVETQLEALSWRFWSCKACSAPMGSLVGKMGFVDADAGFVNQQIIVICVSFCFACANRVLF